MCVVVVVKVRTVEGCLICGSRCMCCAVGSKYVCGGVPSRYVCCSGGGRRLSQNVWGIYKATAKPSRSQG